MKKIRLLTTTALVIASVSVLAGCFGGSDPGDTAYAPEDDYEEELAASSGFGDEEYDDEEYDDEEYDDEEYDDDDEEYDSEVQGASGSEKSYINAWYLPDESGYYIEIFVDGTWSLCDDEGGWVAEGTYLVNEQTICLYNEGDSFYMEAELNDNGQLVNIDTEEVFMPARSNPVSLDAEDEEDEEEEIQYDSDGNKLINYEATKKFEGNWKADDADFILVIWDDEKFCITDEDDNSLAVGGYTVKGKKISMTAYFEKTDEEKEFELELISEKELKDTADGTIYKLID